MKNPPLSPCASSLCFLDKWRDNKAPSGHEFHFTFIEHIHTCGRRVEDRKTIDRNVLRAIRASQGV